MGVNGCPFCDYRGPSPILAEGAYGDVFVIEPINPVTEGHVLVIPREHVGDFAESPVVSTKVLATAIGYIKKLREGKGPGSWNIITSMGPEATQTVFHLHVHIVPRHWDDGLQLPWGLQNEAQRDYWNYADGQRILDEISSGKDMLTHEPIAKEERG